MYEITKAIVQFCAEEVERQGRGPIQVAWMVDAWVVAMLEWPKRSADVGPMLALIITLGSQVEKQNHADSFRTVGVRVGTQICPRPHEVLQLMRRWANNVLNTEMTPEEAYKELMHIHPFADGRVASRRKDRNHKLSRRLVAENVFIAFSKDPIKAVAKRFGKSVLSSGHHQLRSMLSYKSSRTGDTIYVEPDSKNSTMRCSTCGALTGPTGLRGLAVRQWTCSGCGSLHDRDVNAAINASIDGAGMVLERKVA